MDESTGIDNKELLRLSQLSAQELLNECVKLKMALEKADRRAALFLRGYDSMKARYPDIDKAEYNPQWSWVNKIVFVLKKVDRPLLSAEMIDLIKPHELGLQYSYHPAQNFSAYLNKAVRCRRVVAYKQGGTRGFYYVLPHWIKENGNLKRKYEEKIVFR